MDKIIEQSTQMAKDDPRMAWAWFIRKSAEWAGEDVNRLKIRQMAIQLYGKVAQ